MLLQGLTSWRPPNLSPVTIVRRFALEIWGIGIGVGQSFLEDSSRPWLELCFRITSPCE